jgi:hypothetical protein
MVLTGGAGITFYRCTAFVVTKKRTPRGLYSKISAGIHGVIDLPFHGLVPLCCLLAGFGCGFQLLVFTGVFGNVAALFAASRRHQ